MKKKSYFFHPFLLAFHPYSFMIKKGALKLLLFFP